MKKDPLQGLGRRLKLHIIIPAIYVLSLLLIYIFKEW
jgi:hypothetical protein